MGCRLSSSSSSSSPLTSRRPARQTPLQWLGCLPGTRSNRWRGIRLRGKGAAKP